ncbi:MAG: SAM-dependent chlorinase/fluorinase [Bacteroidales bacterium]|nr:SAM-dependent chlorinase/fluorinase [Bacteroidales bacterium]
MAIVTLTTDWGTKDHYLGSVKGILLTQIPDINIVDISHNIPPFDVNQAAYVLKSCYRDFPDGTIHLIGVNSDASPENPHVLIKIDNQYFIGADNGIFSLMFDKQPEAIIALEIIQDTEKYTFSTKDVFAKTCQLIIEGMPIEKMGYQRDELTKMMSFVPAIETDSEGLVSIIGKVIYVDRYENAITNITKELFQEQGQKRGFKISFNSFKNAITEISESYSDVIISEACALFDSNDMLEISVNQGNASSLLGLYRDTKIRLTFE